MGTAPEYGPAKSRGHVMRKRFTVATRAGRLPVVLTVARDDLPPGMRGVQYIVSGRVVATKKLQRRADVKPAHAKRVHARVDAARMSGHLDADGTAFRRTAAVSAAYAETGRRIFGELRKGGCASDPGIEWWEKTGLARFFGRLFADPNYAFLSPGARGRAGGGSLSVGFAGAEGDPREGWLVPAARRVVVNTEHPLFIKYEGVPAARHQRIAMVVMAALLKNAASRRRMGAAEALDLQGRLLDMAKDYMW